VIAVLPPERIPLWRRRPLQIAVASALGAVVIVVGVIAHGASESKANVVARPPTPALVQPPVAPTPVVPPMPTVAVTPAPPPMPTPTPTVETPAPTAVPAPPPPPIVHREPVRPPKPAPRPVAIRPAAKPIEAASKPPPKPAPPRDGAPLVNTSFDDDNNIAPPSKP
jgi:hypothetical protein